MLLPIKLLGIIVDSSDIPEYGILILIFRVKIEDIREVL